MYFNRQTGFTEVALIKVRHEKPSITLSYQKIEFNKQSELVALSFSVDCQDGFSRSASTDKIGNDKRFGFYRDYSENTASAFGTGALKQRLLFVKTWLHYEMQLNVRKSVTTWLTSFVSRLTNTAPAFVLLKFVAFVVLQNCRICLRPETVGWDNPIIQV